MRLTFVGCVTDELKGEWKIFIEEDKKQIKELFSKWKIVNPKHIGRLK